MAESKQILLKNTKMAESHQKLKILTIFVNPGDKMIRSDKTGHPFNKRVIRLINGTVQT